MDTSKRSILDEIPLSELEWMITDWFHFKVYKSVNESHDMRYIFLLLNNAADRGSEEATWLLRHLDKTKWQPSYIGHYIFDSPNLLWIKRCLPSSVDKTCVYSQYFHGLITGNQKYLKRIANVFPKAYALCFSDPSSPYCAYRQDMDAIMHGGDPGARLKSALGGYLPAFRRLLPDVPKMLKCVLLARKIVRIGICNSEDYEFMRTIKDSPDELYVFGRELNGVERLWNYECMLDPRIESYTHLYKREIKNARRRALHVFVATVRRLGRDMARFIAMRVYEQRKESREEN